MSIVNRGISVLVLAGALVAAACSDTNKPEAVNPSTIASGMTGLTSSFSSNLAFQSLRELSSAFTFTAASGTADAVSATLPPMPGEERRFALTPAQRRALIQFALHGPSGTHAIFPVDVLGKTFVWDTTANKYVVSPTETGAPSGGVRFKLYLVAAATHQPQRPLLVVGYVDLTDLSTTQANKLGILVKYGTQTIASYTITGTVATSSVGLRAAGYITDGMARLDFDLSMTISLNQIVVDYSLNGSNGFSATIQATVNLATGSGSLLWRISQGGSTVEVNGTSTSTAVNCQIKFNGVTVATVTGDPDDPTITGAGGQTFTASDLAALQGVLDGFGELMDQIDGVFGPADLVF
jgi:hypothetical protein